MLMVALVPGLLALLFGWLAFRSRVTGVYLSIITQALTYALMLAFFRNDMGFGGNNGMTDFKDILGHAINAPGLAWRCSSRARWRWQSATWPAGTSCCRAPGASTRRSATRKAARDSSATGSSRTRCGCSRSPPCSPASPAPCTCRRWASSIPSEFQPINSIEVVIWVAVGGRGLLYGAVAGAVLVNYAKTYFTAALPEYWLYALGLLFVLVTLFLPRGVVGLCRTGRRERRAKPVQVPPHECAQAAQDTAGRRYSAPAPRRIARRREMPRTARSSTSKTSP